MLADDLATMDARLTLDWLLRHVTDRERGIMQRRIEGKTLAEIGQEEGLTSVRIRQLEQKAFGRMRKAAHRAAVHAAWAIS